MPSDKAPNHLQKKLAEMQAKASAGPQPDLLAGAETPVAKRVPETKRKADVTGDKPSRRKQAVGGVSQGDFFTPVLYDVGARDSRGVMDVAVFRLSKKDKRANSVIRYDLPDGHVEVSSGPHGMASVWDYDIVLMAVSHLTEAMNRFRDGKGEKPSQVFRPHIGDVLKFCRKDNGGNQKDAVAGALQRLSTTFVGIERTNMLRGKLLTTTEGENLIGPFRIISNAKNDKIEYIEIKLADWMYQEITQGTKPDVLTVHPDYFLRESGIGRFVYRLARKAAGKDMAVWGFKTIYQRSGSTGSPKEFNRLLRELITANDLPEYSLSEEEGKEGPMLRMVHRSQGDKWKEAPAEPPKEAGDGAQDAEPAEEKSE
ncbi:replication initiator protein A [Pseudomonas atacamensis]|uniref:replication initiator protein A n=1 Tax=Pseudomonas atacamensis TaxID=2565368 RepID=UPI0019D22FE3|nr:replication initiator protein A [Pseudomonas atacamensis]QSL90518.1 replication initiator protein A [Pseudomonas atacamensis]